MTMNPTSIGSAVRLTTATGKTPAAPAAGLTPHRNNDDPFVNPLAS